MITALNVDKLRLDMGDYVLSVQHVSKRAGRRKLLDAVDLDVKRGACVALIGPADAGKSLLLACIAGAVKPDAGRIRYFGYEIRGRANTRIARMGIVRTSRTAAPFGDMSVLDTVTVGALLRRPLVARAQRHAREILAVTGLTGRAQLPFALLDEVERKRLELARALATDPQLLLLDDLAAGLSVAAAAELAHTLGEVGARGTTIVAAARSIESCPVRADEIVAIERGQTARNGSPCVY